MPRDTQPKGTPGHDRQPEGVEGGDGGGSDFGPPRILLLGPPGAGKTTLAVAMAAKYGIPLVSADAEAKTAADSGSEQGERGRGDKGGKVFVGSRQAPRQKNKMLSNPLQH